MELKYQQSEKELGTFFFSFSAKKIKNKNEKNWNIQQQETIDHEKLL